MVGVFSSWYTNFVIVHSVVPNIAPRENVSFLVSCMSGATYRRLPSGTPIPRARQMMERAIVDGIVAPNDKKVAPVAL